MIDTAKRHTPNETFAQINHAKESKQVEHSLTAYTSYDGDFIEAVRARIAELNALTDAYTMDAAGYPNI